MTYEAERTAIEARFQANWTTTPIKWENVPFEPGTASAFVEIRIATAASFQASLGSPALYRHNGVISINLRVRQNVGTTTAKGYIDSLCAIFRGQTFSSVTCRAPIVSVIGDLNGWYTYNISIPYYRDQAF